MICSTYLPSQVTKEFGTDETDDGDDEDGEEEVPELPNDTVQAKPVVRLLRAPHPLCITNTSPSHQAV